MTPALARGTPPISGSLRLLERRSGPVWYAALRLPHQEQRRLGKAAMVRKARSSPPRAGDPSYRAQWRARPGPTPTGHLSEREAQAQLDEILVDARRRHRQGSVAPALNVTFAEAAAEWLRYVEHERGAKASTLIDYRSVLSTRLLPAFGEMSMVDISPELIEAWRSDLAAERSLNPRTLNKATTIIGGIFRRTQRVWKLTDNPVGRVEKLREPYSGDLNLFDPEEVWALVRAAGSEQDGVLFLLLAFAGLRRGEAIALTWRDVDFSAEAIRVRFSYSHGQVVSTKGGLVRSVPMVPQLARELAVLAQREQLTEADDLVFPGEGGGHLDGSALRRRYIRARDRAGLRPLRLHDLRHCFASLAIDRASSVEVQHWAGHRDARTTARYTHYKSRRDEARRLASAFGGVGGEAGAREALPSYLPR